MTRRSLLRRAICAPVAAVAGLEVNPVKPKPTGWRASMLAYKQWRASRGAEWHGLGGIEYVPKETWTPQRALLELYAKHSAEELQREMLARLKP